MSVRFVIGRAGTGKTHHCLEGVRKQLRNDPIDGPRLVLLVPEQASYQMERSVLDPAHGGPGCVHRAEVLSFRRLAARVLESVGAAARTALTEPARAMVLRRIITAKSDQLHYYGRVARRGKSSGPLAGFVERLGTTIAEFIEEAISPEDFAQLGDATISPQCDDLQRAKLHDLLLIYRAYLDFLGDNTLDPTQHLELARASLPGCDWLSEAKLWVDGFASFSGQETLTLVALAKCCTDVEITVLLDPRLVGSSTASTPFAAGFFTRPFKTYQDLDRRLRGQGLIVNDPLVLAPKTPPRFASTSDLARAERLLFAPGDGTHADKEVTFGGLEIVELPSLRVEVDYAVSRVSRWVQEVETAYRYRDIALIVRDLEPYHDLLTQALTARNIPFFLDRRRPTTHHPLVELLRALVCVASQGLSVESVRLLLKTGLLPLAPDACDELENYLIAHGIAGASVWRGGRWAFRERHSVTGTPPEPTAREIQSLKRINASRALLNDRLGPWLDIAACDATRTGSEWSAALMEWLHRVRVGETLQRWASDAEANGDLDQAEEHRQVWGDVVSLLDDLEYALGESPMTLNELGEVLDSGLSGLTLGLVPPTVDQVLVGSIERSRHPDIKAAVILGFNDGVFPRPVTEDTILNDEDRDLMTSVGLPVRPASRDGCLDEMMLAYIALTRASEALVVTYAASGNAGKVAAPAPYVKDIQAAVPGLAVRHVNDPSRSRDPWSLLSAGDLPSRLCMEFRARPPLDQDDGGLRAAWNELYDTVRSDLARDRIQRWAFSAFDEPTVLTITALQMKRFQKGVLRTSVSRLETYAACGFQYFARYMLKLQERSDAAFKDVDVGQVHHAILEDFVHTLSDRRQGFGALSDDELVGGLAGSCARIAMRLPTDASLSDARNAYLLRRAVEDLEGVIRAQRTLGRAAASRPRFVELPFGFPDESRVPALEVVTPGGRRVFLRGYIDRVDLVELADELLGIVVDYKRTRDKKLKLDMVYHGLSLQLIAYLLVLAESGETIAGRPIRPMAALYQSLKPKYEIVNHPGKVTDRNAALPGARRPDGLIREDRFDALDPSNAVGWSSYYAMNRKKDGGMGNLDNSNAADAESFEAVLDHTRTRLGSLADGILDGCVAVSPVRLGSFNPCSWCAMGSVCRVEAGVSDIRFLPSLKRSDVFRRLTSRPETGREGLS